MSAPSRVTTEHMADLVDRLIRRTRMQDGSTAGETIMVIEPADIRVLKALDVKLAQLVETERFQGRRRA